MGKGERERDNMHGLPHRPIAPRDATDGANFFVPLLTTMRCKLASCARSSLITHQQIKLVAVSSLLSFLPVTCSLHIYHPPPHVLLPMVVAYLHMHNFAAPDCHEKVHFKAASASQSAKWIYLLEVGGLRQTGRHGLVASPLPLRHPSAAHFLHGSSSAAALRSS